MKKWVRRMIDGVRLRGNDVWCPCCGRAARTFLASGICPFCDSRPRQRLMYFYLERTLAAGDRVLHFAPEEALQIALRRVPGVEYTSADLRSPAAAIQVDLESEDDVRARLVAGSYSVIIISHVLEHLVDDNGALRRLVALVRSGGRVLVQVPVDNGRASTYEDWSIASPEDRLKAFGQEDHVRVYGRDLVGRFEAAGVRVRALPVDDICSREDILRCQLEADTIYECSALFESGSTDSVSVRT